MMAQTRYLAKCYNFISTSSALVYLSAWLPFTKTAMKISQRQHVYGLAGHENKQKIPLHPPRSKCARTREMWQAWRRCLFSHLLKHSKATTACKRVPMHHTPEKRLRAIAVLPRWTSWFILSFPGFYACVLIWGCTAPDVPLFLNFYNINTPFRFPGQ